MTDALPLLTGIEGVILAKDIGGSDDPAVRDPFRWTAGAIVRAALEGAKNSV